MDKSRYYGFWEAFFSGDTWYLSGPFLQMLGFGKTYSLKQAADFIVPDHYHNVADFIRSFKEAEPLSVSEKECHWKSKTGKIIRTQVSGQVIKTNEQGHPLHISFYTRETPLPDILPGTIQLAHEQFKNAFEHSAIGMALVGPDGTWLKVNKRISEITGYSEKELLQITFQEITHPDDLDIDLEGVRKLLNGIKDSYQIEKRYFHKKGPIIWVLLSVSLVRDHAGKPVHFISQIQDISGRKQTELLLKERDALLSKLSQQVPGTIYQYLIQPDGTPSFPFASEGIWDVYETTPAEVKNNASKAFERIHPDDIDAVVASITQSQNRLEQWNHDYRVNLPGKGLRWLRGSAQPEKLENGSYIWHGYIHDITEYKANEKELVQLHKQLEAILQSSTYVSIISTDTEGTITHFNKGAETLLGYKAGEMVGIQSPAIIHLEEEVLEYGREISDEFGYTIAGFDVFVARARQEGYDAREWTYRHKNGHTFPVQLVVTAMYNEAGHIIGFLGIATDISEIKEAQKALKLSEERWQFALEGSGDGIWDWNKQTNHVFFSNQWKSMLGFKPDEIENRLDEWKIRVHPDDLPQVFKDLEAHFDGKNPLFVSEHRLMCKDGNYKWILSRGKVIEWMEKGKPLRIIGTHTDLSGQKEKEMELLQSFDIISEQNKRLLNFAHIVSHNLRSHSGNIEMVLTLLNNKPEPEEQEHLIQNLNQISNNLSEAIVHLNEVVSIQTEINKQREPLNLHSYIEKTLDILAGEMQSVKAKVTNTVPEDTVIHYNPAYLESILLNLISNAIKYRHEDRNPEIEIQTRENNGSRTILIRDNGLGIDLKKHRDKLFGMYKTFHRNRDSRGIGLFITKNQVESMGGKIEVESQVNEGTTFKVILG